MQTRNSQVDTRDDLYFVIVFALYVGLLLKCYIKGAEKRRNQFEWWKKTREATWGIDMTVSAFYVCHQPV